MSLHRLFGFVGLACAPRHIVHVHQGIDREEQVATGDADEVHEPIDDHGELLWVEKGRDQIHDGHRYQENTSGSDKCSLLHHFT